MAVATKTSNPKGHKTRLTKLTPEKREEFISILAENGGIVSDAAIDVQVSRVALYQLREADKEFRDQWDAAVKRGNDLLVDEARRRSLKGDKEPIYYQGKRVGWIYRKSEFLLGMLLKAKFVEFRNKDEGPATGTGGVHIYLPDNGRGGTGGDDNGV